MSENGSKSIRLHGPASLAVEALGDAWCVPERYLAALLRRVATLPACRVVEVAPASGPVPGFGVSYRIERGCVGVVAVQGVLTNEGAPRLGLASWSAVERALGIVCDDPQVHGVVLEIDSPGGTVAGAGSVATMIGEISKKKPVVAVCGSHCTGAAFWAASQATKVFAHDDTAIVGGLALRMVTVGPAGSGSDSGALATMHRMERRSGPARGEIPETLADFDQVIREDVSKLKVSARDLERLLEGHTWVALGAPDGLLDEIKRRSEVVADVAGQGSSDDARTAGKGGCS